MKASMSSLQNKSSADIESTIHRSSKSITSSNYTNSYKMSGFSYASNITTEINSRSFSNGSLVFVTDGNFQKLMTSNKNCLDITIADLIIS